MTLIVIYLFVGGAAGFIAGLLGGGSGLVMIPLMVFLFKQRGFDSDIIMHLVIATSLLSTTALGAVSTLLQHRHNAIAWPLFRRMLTGMLFGSIIGCLIADRLPGFALHVFFIVVVVLLAIWMLFYKETSRHWNHGAWGQNIAGLLTAGLTSLAGTSVFSVPYFRKCGLEIRSAIGTATACSLLFSIVSGIIYMLIGLGNPALPPDTLGFVYLPMVLPLAISTAIGGYIGAQASHTIPRHFLKYAYVILMFVVAIKMISSL